MNVRLRRWLALSTLVVLPTLTLTRPACAQTLRVPAAHSKRSALGSDASEEVALSRGILLYKAGRYADALSAFEFAGENNPLASRYRGLAQLKLGDYAAAESEFRSSADIPLSVSVSKGLHRLAQRDFVSAEISMREHLQQQSGDSNAQWLLDVVRAEHEASAVSADPLQEPSYTEPLDAQPGAAVQPPVGDCVCDSGYSWFNDPARRWNYTVLTGYQYDSNVVLSPDFVGLGAPTNKADSSWFVASFGDYRVVQEADCNIGLIFSTYDNFYFNQTHFNLEDYMGGAYGNVALGERWLAGIRFEFHETQLDYRHFAGEYRLVPNLTLLEDDFGHTTAYYEFDSTWFNGEPLVPAQNRDGETNAFGITQAMYGPEGLGRFFVGYRFEGTDTRGSDFKRITHMATARIERPIGKSWVADAEIRQFWDDYDQPNSLDFFDRPRQDQRTEFRSGLQYYVTAHASLRLDYTFIDSNSNVANLFGVNFFEYDRHLLSPQFIYDF